MPAQYLRLPGASRYHERALDALCGASRRGRHGLCTTAARATDSGPSLRGSQGRKLGGRHHEQNLRLIRKIRPEFTVLGSGDEHLLTSYIIGTAGSQVSLAALVPELVVNLWTTAEAGDWTKARTVHETLYPLAVAIYRDAPGGRATARLKACLKLLGRLACDAVRPPQLPLTPTELRALELALQAAAGHDSNE